MRERWSSTNDGNQEQQHVQDSGRDQEDGDGGGEMQGSDPAETAQQKHGKREGNLKPE